MKRAKAQLKQKRQIESSVGMDAGQFTAVTLMGADATVQLSIEPPLGSPSDND